MGKIQDGKLVDPKVKLKVFPTIERGTLKEAVAIVVHQTGASSAESTFQSYRGKANGAHFLVDKDGTIYQTARLTQRTFHVGKIRSRCLETHQCTAAEQQSARAVLHTPGQSYGSRTNLLSQFEKPKPYPKRYPTNDEAIGIEVVGGTPKGAYEPPTPAQNLAVKWLVAELQRELALTGSDVYRHPDIAYKNPTEAKGVQW